MKATGGSSRVEPPDAKVMRRNPVMVWVAPTPLVYERRPFSNARRVILAIDFKSSREIPGA